MTLKQIKGLMEGGNFQEAAEQAQTLVSKDDKNKAARLFLVQSLLGLGKTNDAQTNLNVLYSLVNPNPGPDDPLYLQALHTQNKIAVKIMEDKNAPKKVKETGRQIQLTNTQKLIEFHSKRGQTKKLCEEMETYFLHLLEAGNYKQIEENLLFLYNHPKLTPEQQIGYASRIYTIDQFYNPFTKIETLFQKVLTLTKEKGLSYGQCGDGLHQLATKVMTHLNKQNWRKELHAALNSANLNKSAMADFQRYLQSALPAQEIIFAKSPEQVLTGGPAENSINLVNFCQAISAKSYSLLYGSPSWDSFVNQLRSVTQLPFFEVTLGDIEKNQAQILIFSILDFDKVLKTGRLTDTASDEDLLFVKHFGHKPGSFENLMNFSTKFAGMTPFVNLYVVWCALCLKYTPGQIKAHELQQKLNLATFLQRSIFRDKLGPKGQITDFQVIANILALRVGSYLPADKKESLVEQVDQTIEKISKFASPDCIKLFETEKLETQWKVELANGKWQDSILVLEKVAESKSKESYAKLKIAWIQYSFLDRIAENAEERAIFLKSIFSQLQAIAKADDKNAQPLLMMGKLLFLHDNVAELGLAKNDPKAALSQWLLALKRDQTNADTFYSLAIYYLLNENNLAKAQKCLDKALLLKPNFEAAFILNFYILQREGKAKESIELVKKMQEINKNLASTYYLQAIAYLNEAEYIQAIDNLQNAARFYSIQRSRQMEEGAGLVSVIPETKDLKGRGIAMFDSKLGLFGVSETQFVQVWTHLTLCFSKIGKPQVALKCFVRAMQEIEKIITPQSLEKEPTIASLGEPALESSDSIEKGRTLISKCIPIIEGWQKAGRVKNYAATDQISAQAIRSLTYINALLPKSLDAKQVPRVLEECVEILIMGCRIYPDPEFATQIALSTLKIVSASQQAENFSFISNILAEVIQRATSKIQGSLIMEQGQTVLPKWAQNQIKMLQELVYQCDFDHSSLQLQRAKIGALFAISRRLSDEDLQKKMTLECFKRANELIQRVQLDKEISSDKVYGSIARSALLDAAKIAHQCKLIGIEEADIDLSKIQFVRKAIMLDPNNAELWVHLHILSDQNTDQARRLRSQAIFKAYQLDSEHLFVQEILLKHYLSSKETYQQAFKLIVRSIQTAQQTKRKTDPIQPIIRAVLAYFNAKVCSVEPATSLESDFLRQKQQAQIREAISIIKLIEREDLIQMLSELSCFLQHQSEDYVHIVKYLEAIIGDSSDQVLKTMLFQAYCGSKMKPFGEITHFLGSENSLKDQIVQLSKIEQNSDKDLVSMLKKCQEAFISSPNQNVSQLMVLQEVCIRRGLASDSVILDSAHKFDEILENFNQSDQRILLIQALQLLKMREADKGIMSTNLLEDSSEMSENDDTSTTIDDKVFVLKASRLKPQIIDSSSTHKDLLKVHLQSISSKTALQTIVNQVKKNLQSKVSKGLQTIQNQDVNQLMFAQRNLMKNPHSLEANLQFIWGLIYQSQFEKASKATEMLKRNLTRGVIQKDISEHEENLQKLDFFVRQVINGEKIEDLGDQKLTSLIKSINMRLSSPESPKLQDKEFNDKIDHVAVGLVKALFSSSGAKSESGWLGMFTELTSLLSELLFQSRQFTVFNKLVDRMVQVAGSVPAKSCSKELVGAIWAFKCLHKASALLEMNKVASGTQESSATLKLFRNGFVPRKVTPGMLLQTRSFIAAKNMEQAANTLELVSEDASFVIDFVKAHSLYIQQAYKEYYLLAMGLVSGCKAVLEDMKDEVLGAKKRQAYFTLGYSYYLKMFAECTFLAARRQGLTLAEDFEQEEDARAFDETYFAKKARISHTKGTNALKLAQQENKELGTAFEFMIKQVDQLK